MLSSRTPRKPGAERHLPCSSPGMPRGLRQVHIPDGPRYHQDQMFSRTSFLPELCTLPQLPRSPHLSVALRVLCLSLLTYDVGIIIAPTLRMTKLE